MKYLTLNQIIDGEKYPFTYGQLRSFLINRTQNGLEKAVRKIGRRLYIREDLFIEWIESNPTVTEEKEKNENNI